MKEKGHRQTPQVRYVRFPLYRRVEHALLMLSFTILALTGLPQKFVTHPFSENLILWLGGIQRVRQFHHAAAILLIVTSLMHMLSVGYEIFVLQVKPTMLPSWRDVVYAGQEFAYNLCLRKEKPPAGRYTFREKIEYWAVVWGTLIMALTGFMLWNPITTGRVLPAEIIPAAKAAHGWEAVLAVLSILTWHVYHAHVKHFNKSIFVGWLTEEEMRREHPLELEWLQRGAATSAVRWRTMRRRIIVYGLVASLVVALSSWGIYTFLTMEQTAITTVPRKPTIEPYVPVTPTPTPIPSAWKGASMHVGIEKMPERE